MRYRAYPFENWLGLDFSGFRELFRDYLPYAVIFLFLLACVMDLLGRPFTKEAWTIVPLVLMFFCAWFAAIEANSRARIRKDHPYDYE